MNDSDAPSSTEVRALVVDDDPTNRRVLELILESKGVESASAVNGLEAVDAFRQGSFDVVLMDLQMPVMNGYDAIREIRSFEASRRAARTPVVVVSAYTRARDLELSAAAGADLHLGKPVNVQQLLGALEALTGH
ncbi:MAG: response regulator [Pseudomonadota bacterium]|nr:response regulator [Pseudomonadota bacterium]